MPIIWNYAQRLGHYLQTPLTNVSKQSRREWKGWVQNLKKQSLRPRFFKLLNFFWVLSLCLHLEDLFQGPEFLELWFQTRSKRWWLLNCSSFPMTSIGEGGGYLLPYQIVHLSVVAIQLKFLLFIQISPVVRASGNINQMGLGMPTPP